MNRRALIDCDGVLANLVTPLLDRIYAFLHQPPRLTPYDIRRYDMFSLMTTDECVTAKACMSLPDFWQSLPLIPGAAAGIDRLRRRGYAIGCVSSPYTRCDRWETERRAWLREHVGITEAEFMSVPSELKLVIDGALLIEDNWDTAHAWRAARDRPAVLFDAPYNQMPTAVGVTRMCGWHEIDAMLDRIECRTQAG